jgi:hypothetical protein
MGYWRKERKQISFLKRGLILCEGETEENYFTGLITKEEYRRKFGSISVEIYKPKDHSPKGLIAEAKIKARTAKKEGDPYDFIWAVFDRDGHESSAQAFNDAITYNPPIKIAFSVTCFEYFVLLHFKKSTKAYINCEAVIKELKNFLPEYKKASNLFSLLEEYMDEGLRNSQWCHDHFRNEIDGGKKLYDCNPYSNIHELVYFLFSLIEEKQAQV